MNRYDVVNDLWTAWAPPITPKQAAAVAGKLSRHFGSLRDYPACVARHRFRVPRGRVRRCWASAKGGVTHKGLPRLVHDVSHRIYQWRHPNTRPHEDGHHALERDMTLWMLGSGVLQKLGFDVPALPVVQLLCGHRTGQ